MPLVLNAAKLKPFVKKCGYSGSRLAEDYLFGVQKASLVGFHSKPWDARSACLAVVDANDDSRAVAQSCLPLGAPTVFVCRPDNLDWYKLTPGGPSEPRSVPAAQIEGFFREHSEDLAPDTIYAAKTRRPAKGERQLWFVDVGLMPAVERNAGEDLHRLVEGAIQELAAALKGQLRSRKAFANLYKTVFWLLAAKLLHEKGVDNFRRIDLTDVDDVFRRVGRHYAAVEGLPPGGKAWRPAIDITAQSVAKWGHLGNTSTEALAYLYETALIDKKPTGPAAKKAAKGTDLRKELEIHSTPPPLVDHMLAQLWPLIEQIEPENRRVFEPACGHAAFLVTAMRWLREFSELSEGLDRHRYLRDHLYGVEVDSFACELGRLSLTLADVPYGNSWHIDDKDMFEPGVLQEAAGACTVLLANPPFESFTPADKARYTRLGEPVTAITKAVEMLKRTLPHLPPGGVFGIVVPQRVLHHRESAEVRRRLVTECELADVSLFADNLFEQADHETAILLGRRKRIAEGRRSLWYRRVRERGMDAFKERLEFSLERRVRQERFAKTPSYTLLLPDLEEVWDHLGGLPELGTVCHIQKGFEFLGETKLKGCETVSAKKHPGWTRAVLRADQDYPIWDLPNQVWIDHSPEKLRRPGALPGQPQVILNYAPVAREAWRLKAVVDEEGVAVSRLFVVFRPTDESLHLLVLWAILNSPLANAYAYSFSRKRETRVEEWKRFPVPAISAGAVDAILAATHAYLRAVRPSEGFALGELDDTPIRKALLRMDAEILKLYDLPPRLERQLLDLFWGVERKGVGCEFPAYYPPDFKPYIPLHEYFSEEYRRSTVGEILKRLEPARSEAAIAALNAAEEYAAGE